MKKILIIALALIIVTGLCACSSGGNGGYVDYYEGDAEAEAAAAAEYYATFEFKDNYETEPQTSYCKSGRHCKLFVLQKMRSLWVY